METIRQERINNLLQKDLGEIFQREMKHVSRTAMVTVTRVKVTPELSLARVYISLFATKDKNALMGEIRKHTKEIFPQLFLIINNVFTKDKKIIYVSS